MLRSFTTEQTHDAVTTIKMLSIDGVEKAKSGHPGTPMGLANIAFELFASAMRHDPSDPHWEGRDRFVLSCGHASMLLYSMLHLSGYDLGLEDLKQFRQWGSRTAGHPEVYHTPGVETTTGPLGQGIGNAVGFALAAKMKAARFGELFASRVYVIASDGDVMEGVSAEASSLAGHLGLSNLVVFYDDNRITIEGETDLAFTEDVGKRYEAYGFRVLRIDGHNHAEIRAALDTAALETEKPVFVVARTHIAHGAPNMQDTSKAHGSPFGAEGIAATKVAAGWDPALHFYVPAAVASLFAARKAELIGARAEWNAKYTAWRATDAAKATAWDAFSSRAIPADFYAQLLANVKPGEHATRVHSGHIEQKVAALLPGLVGGSADLAPSTETLIKGTEAVQRNNFGGRNMHFGVREHGMGSIVNGLALAGGFIPFGATFLVFSDYMRPSVRLSALMGLPCVWIYTHDSIFLGEDGPTHQPVEHVSTLRMIPNLAVVRPADGEECAAAWAIAIGRAKAPTALVLTRQKLKTIDRGPNFDPNAMLRGVYVVSTDSGTLDAVIMASGSEMTLAIEAAATLRAEGKKIRVLSALCMETFQQADATVRDAVLPPNVKRVAIEAGSTATWRGIVGERGLAIGIDTFGASAPDKVLAERYGLTTPQVTERIRSWLASN
jgi:transketolase